MVAPVELVITHPSSPYTGLLSTGGGSRTAVMRVSSVLDPTLAGPVPSFALKFFLDGRESVNHVALNTEAPQTATTNPFALPFTNIFVALPSFIQTIFSTVTQFPNATGNSPLAYTYGSTPINFPFQLIWVRAHHETR